MFPPRFIHNPTCPPREERGADGGRKGEGAVVLEDCRDGEGRPPLDCGEKGIGTACRDAEQGGGDVGARQQEEVGEGRRR